MWRGVAGWCRGRPNVDGGSVWKPRLFYDKATWSGLSKGSKEGRDKRVRSQQEKSLQQESGPHPDWQSAVLSDGEPAHVNNN